MSTHMKRRRKPTESDRPFAVLPNLLFLVGLKTPQVLGRVDRSLSRGAVVAKLPCLHAASLPPVPPAVAWVGDSVRSAVSMCAVPCLAMFRSIC